MNFRAAFKPANCLKLDLTGVSSCSTKPRMMRLVVMSVVVVMHGSVREGLEKDLAVTGGGGMGNAGSRYPMASHVAAEGPSPGGCSREAKRKKQLLCT